MVAPQPLSKAEELQGRVRAFIRSVGNVNAKESMTFRRLVRDAQDLAKTNVVEGNCLEGVLVGLVGDDTQAERLFANAAANQGGVVAKAARLSHLVNRMYFSDAFKLGVELVARREGLQFHNLAHRLLMAGGFHAVLSAVDESRQRGEVLQLTKDIEAARAAVDVLDRLGIDDQHCMRVLDTLGEVVRAEGLVWLDDFPGMSVLSDVDDESALTVSFRFAITPAQAAELGWRFSELLVERDLDRSGFYVQVLGQGAEALQYEPA
ncbi:hypothetical protein SOM08_06020 [Hydrogenophaga sp. SNF1]|uniref:hypothetical protein n=1 Tax=Hydrogenophaga sp. SNF1 TaxID=3098762 RepID=UPI002ACBEDD3|nr:hypothetical protein [Hydrogenophaga sp. SNF1]WQB84867.1 hypothetical protein SOM08_06020 [Hydrogenophaga sp. SNF1]